MKKLLVLMTSALFITLVLLQSYRYNDSELLDYSVSRSVLRLTTGSSNATGFVIEFKNKKYVLTNHHVCEGNDKMRGQNGALFFDLLVQFSDKLVDLCILNFDGDLPALKLYPFNKRVAKVYKTLGHPFGLDQVISSGNYVQPFLQQYPLPYPPAKCPVPNTKVEDVQNPNLKMLMFFLQLPEVCLGVVKFQMYKLDTFPGNSGSPLYDGAGYVHGIISMTMNGIFGIAASNEEIEAFLNRYEKTL